MNRSAGPTPIRVGFQSDGTLVDAEGRIYLASPRIVELADLRAVLDDARALAFDECGCHDEWCTGARWAPRSELDELRARRELRLQPVFRRSLERWVTERGRVAVVVNFRASWDSKRAPR